MPLNCDKKGTAIKHVTTIIFPQVTFLLTEDPIYTTDSRERKRRNMRRRKRSREPLSPDRFSLYSSLSSLSGGLTIFTTNSDIERVSTIVEDNTAADKVAARSFDGDQRFTQLNQMKRVVKAKKAAISMVTGRLCMSTDCDQGIFFLVVFE